MKKTRSLTAFGLAIVGAWVFALGLAGPITAAEKPSPAAHQATTTKSARIAWAPETLSGKILMVDPAHRLLVVEGRRGVPFDMVVTSSTRIEQGNQRLTLTDLAAEKNKGVSVRFVPERRGNVARSVQVTG